MAVGIARSSAPQQHTSFTQATVKSVQRSSELETPASSGKSVCSYKPQGAANDLPPHWNVVAKEV